jgi:hypothetical protein
MGGQGLLWAWDEAALPTLLDALGDESWRVREMAAKVIARHRIGDAFDAMAALRDDSVPRVRAAAERAVRLLIASARSRSLLTSGLSPVVAGADASLLASPPVRPTSQDLDSCRGHRPANTESRSATGVLREVAG